MKNKIILLVVLAVVVGGYLVWRSYGDDKNAAAETALQTARVTRGTLEDVVTSQGKLEAKEYVDVGAQASGQLKKLAVEIGDIVKQGDLIAEIDPRVYQSKVAGDEAQLKTLQAQLAEQMAQITLARQQYDRNSRLLKVKAVSQDVLQTSDTALKVANARAVSLKAQIEQAESTLTGDKANLSFTTIYAPISGTVVSATAREGQTLNANQTAPIIVQLANLDTMTARAQVAEADVLRLQPQQDVYFTVLGNLDRKWHGNIRQILPTPEIVNEVVLYNVLVDVENTDHILMSGMTTQMFFQLSHADNVLVIPTEALRKPVPQSDNDTGKAFIVQTRAGKETADKLVHVGLSTRAQTEIRDGLAENDEVVLPKIDVKPAAAGGGRPSMGPRI